MANGAKQIIADYTFGDSLFIRFTTGAYQAGSTTITASVVLLINWVQRQHTQTTLTNLIE